MTSEAKEVDPLSELPNRIADKIHIVPYCGCWIWAGCLKEGYGKTTYPDAKSVVLHRLVWETVNGPIPEGLQVLHKCDNRACCCPDHLFLGTDLDNVRDAIAKGRRADTSGAGNGNARLNWEQVVDIRRRKTTVRAAAEKHGISVAHAERILAGKAWRC